MPNVWLESGFRFFFYSNDHLPMHVHVRGHGGEAKFNIDPIEIIGVYGLTPKDLKAIEKIISEHQHIFIDAWNNHFNQ